MTDWEELVRADKNPKAEVTIAMVGKYVTFEDRTRA